MAYSGQDYARSFAMHREALLELLDQIPDDRGDFKAWDGGMSFQGIANHLAGASERTLAMLQGRAPQKPEPSVDFASAKRQLRDNAAAVQQALSGASEAQLGTVIEAFGGRKMPLSTLLELMRDREAHHKGQIWTMARMVGVNPPMFVKIGNLVV